MGAAPADAVATSERHHPLTSVQHTFNCHYTMPGVAGHAVANSIGHTAVLHQQHRPTKPELLRAFGSMHTMKVAHNLKKFCAKEQPDLQFITLGSSSTWWHLAHHLIALASRCRPLSLESSLAAGGVWLTAQALKSPAMETSVPPRLPRQWNVALWAAIC